MVVLAVVAQRPAVTGEAEAWLFGWLVSFGCITLVVIHPAISTHHMRLGACVNGLLADGACVHGQAAISNELMVKRVCSVAPLVKPTRR